MTWLWGPVVTLVVVLVWYVPDWVKAYKRKRRSHKSCACLCHTPGPEWMLEEGCDCGLWIYIPTQFLP